MAYDHFLAIYKPLQYATIMTHSVCNYLAFDSWLGGTLHSLFQTSFMFRLPFCGPNHIDYLFCDIPPMLCLACADTTITKLVIFVDTDFLAFTCFVLILTSYGYIVAAIPQIQSADGCRPPHCCYHLLCALYLHLPSSWLTGTS